MAACARDEHQLLGQRHQLLVVGVGLVELEHRELGVVLRRDALVPEVARDLVDALEAADDEPLQIQLRRDAQEEIHVERVVVRHERPRRAPPAIGCITGVSTSRKPRASRKRRIAAITLAAHLEHAPRVRVDDQVEVALAVAGLDIGAARAISRAAAGGTSRESRGCVAQIVSSPVLVRNRCPATPMWSPKSSSLKIWKSRSGSASWRT